MPHSLSVEPRASLGDGRERVTVVVTGPDRYINDNVSGRGLSWDAKMARARATNEWRSAAQWCHRARFLPLYGTAVGPSTPLFTRAALTATVHFRDLRTRDVLNVSLKAVIDGAVDAGILPDDSWRHLHYVGHGARLERGCRPTIVMTWEGDRA